MSSLSTILSQWNAATDPAERARLADLVATQVELELNDQANRATAALWMTDERLQGKIDRLHEQVQANNTLVSADIEGTQAIARELKLGVGNVIEAIRALRERMDALDLRDQAQYDESRQDRLTLRQTIENYIAQLPPPDRARLIAYTEQIPALRHDLDALIRRLAALEAALHAARDAGAG